MGTKTKAICKCGVNTDIMIGGGKLTFKYQCYFPCLCEGCDDVVEVNLLNKNPQCPICSDKSIIPYDDELVIGVKGKKNIVSWNVQSAIGRELILTNGTYKCPKCNKMTLEFLPSLMMWD